MTASAPSLLIQLADFFCLRKKFLVFNLVSRNLKIKYRRSVFGIFWTLMAPLSQAAVYYFAFQIVLKIEQPRYLTFIICGMLPWSFFSMSVSEGLSSVVDSLGLLSKIPVPIQVFPMIATLTNWITLLFSVPILFIVSQYNHVQFGPSLLLLPFYYLGLFLITYSLALILAILYVYLRDLKHFIGLVFQLWIYATPVLYSETIMPPKYHWLIYLNPVGTFFTSMHEIWVWGRMPATLDIGVFAAWSLGSVVVAFLVRKYMARAVVEIL